MRRPTDKNSVAILLPFPPYAFDSPLCFRKTACHLAKLNTYLRRKARMDYKPAIVPNFFYDYILYCSLTHL